MFEFRTFESASVPLHSLFRAPLSRRGGLHYELLTKIRFKVPEEYQAAAQNKEAEVDIVAPLIAHAQTLLAVEHGHPLVDKKASRIEL
ncbi:hypothetical protein [Stigmatella aurantiaca]|uniref:hypothetical protein n=1 Tax=Stigmatella aurantiaca TaxID=41 RepID=UPI000561A7E3|nr:hypothetical protein [Stigmatella aurantiaca]